MAKCDIREKKEPTSSASKQKKHGEAVFLSILAICLVSIAIFLLLPQVLNLFSQLNPGPTTTPTTFAPPTALPTPTPEPTTNLTPIPQPSTAPVDQELAAYTLALINSDRQAAGLQNVTLSAVNSGQIQAENMLKNNYVGHWDTNGYKPYMRYTLAGGKGAVSENCAWQWATGGTSPIDVKSFLKDMEYSLMNDDASSNWDHRDNILDPLHNKVSIGIAYDNSNVYLVQDFENDYVSWNTQSFNGKQVTLQGEISKQNSTVQGVSIFYDNPQNLTATQLKSARYNDGYDPGEYVGMALPPNFQANDGITITCDSWKLQGSSFQITFSLSQAIAKYGAGVYTLYMQIGPSTTDSLTTYSIWIG